MFERKPNSLDAITALLIRIAGAGCVFAMQVVLARVMPDDGYGSFVTLWTWLLALGSFAALGFAESSVRFLPRYSVRQREGAIAGFWHFGLRVVLVASLVLAIVGIGIGIGLGPGDGLGLIVLLVALGLPFLALEYFLEGVARSFGWFRLAAAPVYIIRPLLVSSLVLAATGLGFDADLALVGGIMIASMGVITFGLGLVLARKLAAYGVGRSASSRHKRLWLRASLPLLVLSGIEDLAGYADVLVLSLLMPAQEVALYFAASRCLALGGFVAYAMTLVAGRRYGLDLAAGVPEQLQRSLNAGTVLTFGVTVLVVGATLVLAPLLLAAFGPDYVAAYPVVAILGMGMVLKAMSGQAQEALIVMGKSRAGIGVNAVALVASIVLVVVLTPVFGIIGAAIGAAGAMGVRSLALAIGLRRATGMSVLRLD